MTERIEINTHLKRNDLGSSQTNLYDGKEKKYDFGVSAHDLEEIMEKYKERGDDFKDLKFFRAQNGITNLLHSLLTN